MIQCSLSPTHAHTWAHTIYPLPCFTFFSPSYLPLFTVSCILGIYIVYYCLPHKNLSSQRVGIFQFWCLVPRARPGTQVGLKNTSEWKERAGVCVHSICGENSFWEPALHQVNQIILSKKGYYQVHMSQTSRTCHGYKLPEQWVRTWTRCLHTKSVLTIKPLT